MDLLGTVRRRPLLFHLLVVVAVCAASAAVYLAVRPVDGEIAMRFLDAVEEGDMDEAAGLVDLWPNEYGDVSVFTAVRPTWPWHAERIAEIIPSDSAYDYDAVIEVGSTDPAHPGRARIGFSVGSPPVIIDPVVRVELMALNTAGVVFTIGDEQVGTGTYAKLALYPGVYQVVAAPVGGGTPSRATMTVLPKRGPADPDPGVTFTFP